MTIQVWTRTLLQASADWERQGDDLHGARKTLAGAEDGVDLLGSRVAPAAAAFLAAWAGRVDALRTRAEAHSTALSETAGELLTSDRDTVAAMQRLLPWGDRDTLPVQPGGPR